VNIHIFDFSVFVYSAHCCRWRRTNGDPVFAAGYMKPSLSFM